MATKQALDALEKANDALLLIREKLKPFLEQLDDDDTVVDDDHENLDAVTTTDDIDNVTASQQNESKDVVPPNLPTNKFHPMARKKKALAQAAVALSIGTLRVMGARLRGQDRGRTPDDPLRQQLNQIRTRLVSVQKIKVPSQSMVQENEKSANNDGKNDKNDKIINTTMNSGLKRKSALKMAHNGDDKVAGADTTEKRKKVKKTHNT